MAGPDDPFTVATCRRIRAEHELHPYPEEIKKELNRIRDNIALQ
ncbi:hypothetical protein AB0C81_09595 [Streptomyces roseoverticillatus]